MGVLSVFTRKVNALFLEQLRTSDELLNNFMADFKAADRLPEVVSWSIGQWGDDMPRELAEVIVDSVEPQIARSILAHLQGAIERRPRDATSPG